MNNGSSFLPASYSSAIEMFGRPIYFEDAKWRIAANLIWTGFLLLGCVGVFIIGGISAPSFLSSVNLSSIMFSLLGTGLIAMVAVVIVSNGGMDLSVGAVISLVGVVVATLTRADMNPLATMFLGLCTALLIGLANGILVGLARLPGFLVTLAMMFLIRSISLTTSSYQSIPLRPSVSLDGVRPIGYFLLVLLLAISVLWIQFPGVGASASMNLTEKNQSWLKRACLLGTPYVASSLAAGFVGLMVLGRLRLADPLSGTDYEVTVVMAVILGGTCLGGFFGNAIGALLGAFLMACSQNLLPYLGADFGRVRVVLGALFIVSIGLTYSFHAIVGVLYRRRRGAFQRHKEPANA